MKAVIHNHYDTTFTEAVSLRTDVPLPQPQAGQVLVKVAAAAANPFDTHVVSGKTKAIDGPNLQPASKPIVGCDMAGVITAIPEDSAAAAKAAGLSVGDRVCGFQPKVGKQLSPGSMAEYCASYTTHLAKVPVSLPLTEAAGLPLAGNCAFQALDGRAKIKRGQKLLVLGGSTAIGLLSMQLAADYGCSEIVCTSTNHALCEKFGATRVINYKESSWEKELKGQNFDVVFDCAEGYSGWAGSQQVLKPAWGSFVTVVMDKPPQALDAIGFTTIGSWAFGMINRKFWSMFGYPSYNFIMADPAADNGLKYFLSLAEKKALPSVLDPRSPFPFTPEGTAAMLTRQASGCAKGKLVTIISEELAS